MTVTSATCDRMVGAIFRYTGACTVTACCGTNRARPTVGDSDNANGAPLLRQNQVPGPTDGSGSANSNCVSDAYMVLWLISGDETNMGCLTCVGVVPPACWNDRLLRVLCCPTNVGLLAADRLYGDGAGKIDIICFLSWTVDNSFKFLGITVFIRPNTPVITCICPPYGKTGGHTNITITGRSFTGTTGVTIGGTAVTNLCVVSCTSLTMRTPAAGAGLQPILITTCKGTNVAIHSMGGGACKGMDFFIYNDPKVCIEIRAVSSWHGADNSCTCVCIPLPKGTAACDLLLVLIDRWYTAGSWTTVPDCLTEFAAHNGAINQMDNDYFYKTADGNEPDPIPFVDSSGRATSATAWRIFRAANVEPVEGAIVGTTTCAPNPNASGTEACAGDHLVITGLGGSQLCG